MACVHACRSGTFAVQTPALRAIGYVVMGNDTQTQFIIDLSITSVLPSLLTSAEKSIMKEACWTLAGADPIPGRGGRVPPTAQFSAGL
jgi:hypothetical protein